MLVTVLRYRAITGDQASGDPAITDWITDATARLEDVLDRKLEEDEYTESMFPTRDGSLWPHAIPITVAPDGYTVDGNRLRGGSHPWFWPSPFLTTNFVEVTYTGGWVERSDPDNAAVANRLPVCIEEDIAIAAYLIGHPMGMAAQAAVPAGAVSVALGDASINYGPNGAPIARPARIAWSRHTLGYRFVRIGGEPC